MNHDVDEKLYFRFEDEFVGAGIRCIPMIVRFKLDACGIKLKLAEWSRMNAGERRHLAQAACHSSDEAGRYREYLCRCISQRTGNTPTTIPVPQNPPWSRLDEIPYTIREKLADTPSSLSLEQWQHLSDLQRFALLKLSYPGHENKNFPKALEEFGM